MRTSYDTKNEILNVFLYELRTWDKVVNEFNYKPIEFLARTGSYYPPLLEKMFLDIYSLRVTRALWIGPRGGGKTFGLGDLAAALFLFKGFDILIASGGEGQSKEVYEEVTNVLDIEDEEVARQVTSQTTQITKGRKGNWIRFLPASTKRARGPHPGRGHGGVIILDEECEMEEKIVKAVLGTGSTAKPLIIIRASTAHNIDGTFADLLEDYEKRGYTLYKWDAFDVSEKCTRKCEECIPKFRDDYCRGKAHNNSVLGWISLDYLFQMWEEETKDWFEVELMGRRPSGSSYVIDRNDFQKALVDEAPFVPGEPGAIGVDWGFVGMTAAVATQMVDGKLRIFDRESWTRKGTEIIIGDLKGWRDTYGIDEVYADSSHQFQNDALRNADFKVTEVMFVSFKEAGAGAVKWFFEKMRIEVPKHFTDLVNSLKKWKRDKHGKIVKKEDHFADALLCTMQKWWKKARRRVGYTRVSKKR